MKISGAKKEEIVAKITNSRLNALSLEDLQEMFIEKETNYLNNESDADLVEMAKDELGWTDEDLED